MEKVNQNENISNEGNEIKEDEIILKCKGIITKIIFKDDECKVLLQTEQQYKTIEKDVNNLENVLNLFEIQNTIEEENIPKTDLEIKKLKITQTFAVKGNMCHFIELNKKYIFTIEKSKVKSNEYEITEIEICQN